VHLHIYIYIVRFAIRDRRHGLQIICGSTYSRFFSIPFVYIIILYIPSYNVLYIIIIYTYPSDSQTSRSVVAVIRNLRVIFIYKIYYIGTHVNFILLYDNAYIMSFELYSAVSHKYNILVHFIRIYNIHIDVFNCFEIL